MSQSTIAVAADHRGVSLKRVLKDALTARCYDVLDMGTDSEESVDYPDFAHRLAEAVAEGRVSRGLLICGTGIGMAMAANRHPGVRAAVVCDERAARLARAHNDANVLCLGGDTMTPEMGLKCLEAFLSTEFEGGRHQRRVAKLG